MSEYPRDEFDELAASGPTGAHRAVRPRWRTYLPFLIILIVAPLLAWGVVVAAVAAVTILCLFAPPSVAWMHRTRDDAAR